MRFVWLVPILVQHTIKWIEILVPVSFVPYLVPMQYQKRASHLPLFVLPPAPLFQVHKSTFLHPL